MMTMNIELPQTRLWQTIAGLIATVALWHSSAYAQLDRVYPVSGSTVTGKITDVQPDGVVISVGNSTQPFRIDDIRKITWEGDPGPLTRGRDFAIEGQYQSGLEQLKTVDPSSISREYIAADLLFYRAYCEAKLAIAGQGSKDEAKTSLLNFARNHQKSFHFYESAELLGDLAVSVGDYAGATNYYGALGRSASPLMKVRAAYLVAHSALRQGNLDEAVTNFEKVISANIEGATAIRLKNLARAGLAVAKAKKGQGKEALAQSNDLIAQLNLEDFEMAARVYNARGAANEALGDDEAALLDYLHTHLLFASAADAHAEALSRLVTLWGKVGKPEEANQARQELQSRYPGWGG